MISLLEIAKSIDEAEMKLKPKGGGKVVVFKNKDNYEKALKSGDYEEPEGSKKVKSKDSDMDFGRTADDEDDDGIHPDDEKNASEKENEKLEKELQNIAKDKGLTVGSEEANYGGEIHSLVGKDDDPDNTLGFHAAPNFDDDGNMTDEPQYAIELGMGSSPMYFGRKEEADAALEKIVDDERIRKAMDGEGDETLYDLGDYAKSIVRGKDETITFNGKQYRAIKEENKKSNPRVLKEIYERTFRSLK
jgi:hypothetical protein|tara:strand:- start:134 stop:874 length:741 start_codon:yes stop_codon:yes gene_type:complete